VMQACCTWCTKFQYGNVLKQLSIFTVWIWAQSWFHPAYSALNELFLTGGYSFHVAYWRNLLIYTTFFSSQSQLISFTCLILKLSTTRTVLFIRDSALGNVCKLCLKFIV
jgi:hypothetical protein